MEVVNDDQPVEQRQLVELVKRHEVLDAVYVSFVCEHYLNIYTLREIDKAREREREGHRQGADATMVALPEPEQ